MLAMWVLDLGLQVRVLLKSTSKCHFFHTQVLLILRWSEACRPAAAGPLHVVHEDGAFLNAIIRVERAWKLTLKFRPQSLNRDRVVFFCVCSRRETGRNRVQIPDQLLEAFKNKITTSATVRPLM